mmetsp:Transcript_7110/g.19233  ORF Transcript_7110/g.19233 Transcript_7110/m.19233 type:complete len:492 (-) Transcript_7110:24-1499(-)|eukprot:CAMPEP_0171209172 /NCGR_PEP_ID=MMETSP0790-20130122/28460_1 /TAXON_ID=2925 /ORGANISM="Alexandrium catenella, Strain OF101" /LENGTH=491 /DNA_ID=CAMNT_0011674777 /DNA_START=68 /DNA_END=1543 /DNA_ORIENTATION=-
MVCASSLQSSLPAGPQMTWVHPVTQVDWSVKDQMATSASEPLASECFAGPVVVPELPTFIAQDVAARMDLAGSAAQQTHDYQLPGLVCGAADGLALQMAPVQLYPVQFIMCDVNGQPQQQAVAWPASTALAQDPPSQQPFVQPELHQQEVLQPLEQQDAQEHEQQTAPALSTSAKRRLRRQRAAERWAQRAEQCAMAPAEGSGPSLARGGAASESAEPLPLDCAVLTSALEAGGERRRAALAAVCGDVARLSFSPEGCRLVQAAFQVADSASAAALVSELHGHVLDALTSPHANYVIQAVITALPTAVSSFVVKEMLGSGVAVARHRFGCRALCRLVEHSSGGEEVAVLFQELLLEAESHCQHPFAHYVIECMLEHLPENRQRLVQALRANLWDNACHRCASHVVEAALVHGSEGDRQSIVLQLLGSGADSVVSLAQIPHGCIVLKAVLQVPCKLSEEALVHLSQAAPLLEGTKCGLHLLQDLGLGAHVAV